VPFRTYGSRHGFGNVIFPGVGTAPPFGRAFSYYRRPFGPHYRYRFYRPWPYRFWGYPWMAPLAFPVFVGGYAWPDPPAPNVIIINQRADPENRPTRASDDEDAIYQILFKDRSAAPVVAHWVDQDTLHYVTSEGAHWLVPLDSVDRALTEQFNRAKKIEFR